MTLEAMGVQLTQLVLLLAPPILVISVRLLKLRSLGGVRHYLLFGGAGVAHGLLMYAGLVVSEWRPGRDWTAGMIMVVAESAARVAGLFAVAYLVVALVLDLLPIGRSND